MTTVKIEFDKITAAITALEDLAGDIETQSSRAISQTPIALPSLTPLSKKAQWLRDHREDLESRRDLAILLDKEGTGTASYTVTVDTLRNVQDMLGKELANAAADLDHNPDTEDVERISALLARWQEDPEVMSSMFTELGPDGTVATLANISAAMRFSSVEHEKLQTVAERLRSGMSTASEAPGFPAEDFARDIVRYSVAPMLSTEELRAFEDEFGISVSAGANLLTFVMQDTSYSDDFLLGAARTLDEYEQMGDGGFDHASYWYSHTGHGPLDTGNDSGWYDDPMAAIMHNLGENPQAGLTFFTEDEGRQKFYFNDRSWEADGYGGISHAVEGIGTDATNLQTNAEDTTKLVSQFLDEVTNSPGFNPEDAKAASPHIAGLLKFYMPAVDNTLKYGEHEGDGRSMPLSIEYFGDFEHYPQLYKDDLNTLMRVAMGTQDGTERVAEGIAAYQQTRVNNMAAELALDPTNGTLRQELIDVLQGRAALHGFAESSVGRVEIDGAASRDAQRQAFLDAVSSATSLVPLPGADLVGEGGSKLIDYGFNQAVSIGSGEVSDSWTNEAASVADDASVRADESLRRVKVDTFYSLVESGIVAKEDVPAQWLDERGRLKNPSDISREDLPSYAQSAMNVVNDYASDDQISGPYKDQFMKYYEEASN